MGIPILGRLSIREWVIIFISIAFASIGLLKSLLKTIVPLPIRFFIDQVNEKIVHLVSSFFSLISVIKLLKVFEEIKHHMNYNIKFQSNPEEYSLMNGLVKCRNVQEMCLLFGYDVESHIIKTRDNYLLTAQRLVKVDDVCERRRSNGKVVYFHHGLLQDSEIWVTMIDKDSNLPFILYDLGYDVWLGNNRGNKYSQKHLFFRIDSDDFWDFSIDEFALFDIPSTIDYILEVSGKPSLVYIGFSQGSAQAFASISINPRLNEKIEKLIAISPATTPHGLYSVFIDILLQSSPNILFLLFSRKVFIPSIIFWKKVLYPAFFGTTVDLANLMLFNWKSENIKKTQKLASYAHLYSTTSVKTVVHWIQIISSKKLQMFHDSKFGLTGFSPISYPLKNIKVPIHLIYGTSDSLINIDIIKDQLPSELTTVQSVLDHEHLDNLWGSDAVDTVFKYVLDSMSTTSTEII